MVVDHHSHFLTSFRDDRECDLLIDDAFPDDHLLFLATSSIPWYTNLVNYLAWGIVLSDMNYNQKKRFFSQAKSYFVKESCLYKACEDGII